MATCRALAVSRHSPERALDRRDQGVQSPPPSVERPEVAAGDADQRDEVLAVPEAVAVCLTQTDAAVEDRAIEASGVDLDGGRQVGRCVAEAEPAAVGLDQLQKTTLHAAERSECDSPGCRLDAGHPTGAYSWNACSHGRNCCGPTLGS